tara:strand:+ start:4640 stop:4789 length:150 start_codon:yes stop_codon:yes gene_type:complete
MLLYQVFLPLGQVAIVLPHPEKNDEVSASGGNHGIRRSVELEYGGDSAF